MLSLAAALLVIAGLQSSAADRSHAEELARAGRATEALVLFEQIVQKNPADIEAHLWVARLALRLGRLPEAESEFRAVLKEHPADVDAHIGLGMVLTRAGKWREALETLHAVEPSAGANADLFAALARAYRRGGDDGGAVEYFARAHELSPDDPDIELGYETVVRVYGHVIGIDGVDQTGAGGTADLQVGTLAGAVRVAPRVHLSASIKVQQTNGDSDTLGGAGVVWRMPSATTASVTALGGSGNSSLPTSDISADVIHYAGSFEAGAGVRRLTFSDADVLAASPTFAFDPDGRWRLDLRYTYSWSHFVQTGESMGNHSIMLRETCQAWRRVALLAVYAYGIESFEDLTADRLGALGTTTAAVGVRIDLHSLTRLTTTWEHQWRSNDTMVNRVTVSIVQSLR